MTRKVLINFYDQCEHCKIGYCCYQDDNISKYDLKLIGSNSGVYGWNWSAYYYPATDTLYISCYRAVPAYCKEK